MRVAVTGCGGFLGGHLWKRLVADGHEVRGFDIKLLHNWWQPDEVGAIDAWHLDLRRQTSERNPFKDVDWVFHLASDMGGRGYIDTHESACAMNAMLDCNVLRLAADAKVSRFFYASSACVYPVEFQGHGSWQRLAERHALPPYHPDGVYGFEKLFGEVAATAFARDGLLDVRIGRFHGIFGSHGSWNDGKEKAPAALLRKAAVSALKGVPIEVWGDGTQRRSFLHVDEAVEAVVRLMASDYREPLNIGSEEVVSIDEVARMCAEIAGTRGPIIHVIGAEGPHSRGSDNTGIERALGWKPRGRLYDGLASSYPWVAQQVAANG